MKRIVVDKGDSTVLILAPAQEWLDQPGNNMEKLRKKDVPKGLSSRITDTENIPSDRTFREAWHDDKPGKQIDIDMPRAKEIQIARIKEKRQEKFIEMGFPVQLDPDLEEAIIPEVTRGKLKALRDLPETFDLSSAKTPEQLKALWPEELS